VWRRRWKWVEDCKEWSEFAAWRSAQGWGERVELEAGLDMLLDEGPVGNCPKVGDDLYVVYACCQGRLFWLIVGVAQPPARGLLPLAWGASQPTRSRIAEAAARAAVKLRAWRARS
jgi:hypothetical protein